MPNTCPQCGELINSLEREIHTRNDIESIDGDGERELVDHVPVYPDGEGLWWCCPHCWSRITISDEEAERFINNTTELERNVKEVVGEEDG